MNIKIKKNKNIKIVEGISLSKTFIEGILFPFTLRKKFNLEVVNYDSGIDGGQ